MDAPDQWLAASTPGVLAFGNIAPTRPDRKSRAQKYPKSGSHWPRGRVADHSASRRTVSPPVIVLISPPPETFQWRLTRLWNVQQSRSRFVVSSRQPGLRKIRPDSS